MANVQAGKIGELKAGIKGEILLPSDGAYEGARKIWNAMIDKRPAVIARCATTSDVVRGVNFARDNGLLLAVRGGGHNIAGNAMCDDGLVIDLSKMKAARVDPAERRVTIEGGATLADLDAATQAHGLATPVGINSTTGIAGLTLGGGFGWLSRKYGMTVDNLESAEVVTAAGEVVRASATEHPDLYWALRGGGGNFGVVTRFEFRLHPVGPDVLSGLIVYPISEAKSVLQQYREFMAKAPEPGAPLKGANSFTESQAKDRAMAAGLTSVSSFNKDGDGIWRGNAMKDGKSVKVALDFKGNVVSE